MGPLFVIEDERDVQSAADYKSSARNLNIVRTKRNQRVMISDFGLGIGETWSGVTEGLSSISQRLGMHSLVKGG